MARQSQTSQTAVEDAQEGAIVGGGEVEEVVNIPMPDEFSVWDTKYFDPTELIIDHTQNGRRFGIKADKVLAIREDFLNPDIGQLQECGVYWNTEKGGFQMAFGYHRAAAAIGITTDQIGPDEGGSYLLRCVILPSSGVVGAMGLNLAENSDRTRTTLSPMDKAYIVTRMLENGYNQKDISIRLGYSKAIISQVKHLTDFPLKVQKAIDQGKVTQAAAFELIELKENPDALQAKVDEMIAGAGGGNVGTGAVRAARRKRAEEEETGGGEAVEETNGNGAGKAAREPKTTRSLKEIMAFLRDNSDYEKGVEPIPSQTLLKIVLKYAEGKIKEKAAVNQIDKAMGYVKE